MAILEFNKEEAEKLKQYEEALTSTKDLIRVLNKEKLQL